MLKRGKSSRKTFSLGHTKGQGASKGVFVGPSDQSDCRKPHHLSPIPWDGHLVHHDLLNTCNTYCRAPAQTPQQASTVGSSDDVTVSEVLTLSCKRTAWPAATTVASTCMGLGAAAPSPRPEAHPEDASRILGPVVPLKAWQGRQSTAMAPSPQGHLRAAQTSILMPAEKGGRGI